MPSVHRQTLVDLVNANGWRRGAELGVDKGILTGMLLRQCPTLERLVAVDVFPDLHRSRRVFEMADEMGSRLDITHATTVEAAKLYEDGSFDFVFIDADHSYEAVRADIAAWAPKVRVGGWLGGHDYHPRKFPGVVKVVDGAFGKDAHFLPGTIWGVWV